MVRSGFELRQSGFTIFYLDCCSARRGWQPSGLRKGRIAKGKSWFDFVRKWIFSTCDFLKCLGLSAFLITIW